VGLRGGRLHEHFGIWCVDDLVYTVALPLLIWVKSHKC
jgi:hypothetical protein